jgi:small subunit ribosomal protein S16
VAVRIRMKKFGRRHRPFYRICAMDVRSPRDGRVLEELGTYDPLVPDVDARAMLKGERIKYWLGVGALPSDKVKVLIKKYGFRGTHLAQQHVALDRLAQRRRRPEPLSAPRKGEAAEAEHSAAETEVDAPLADAADQPASQKAQDE